LINITYDVICRYAQLTGRALKDAMAFYLLQKSQQKDLQIAFFGALFGKLQRRVSAASEILTIVQ